MTTAVPRFATIVASNYLANARVLADSIDRVHPGTRTSVLVTDGAMPAAYPTIDWVMPDVLGLSEAELHRMATMYDVTEFATAVKPMLLRALLRDADVVTYLDPDIEVFTRLDEATEEARARGIALTPHRLHPASELGRPTDRELLVAGGFNLGFIAVGQSAVPFLDWWAERVRLNCVVAADEGLFVDQKWLDLATVYFDHHVVRDPGYNVAWWNLDERPLESTELRFFHFSGFDPLYPDELHRRDPTHPRPVPAPVGAVRALTDAHAERLLVAGWAAERSLPYRYANAANGEPLTPAVRRVYRAHAMRDGAVLPDPFDPAEADAFARWSARTRRTEKALVLARRAYRKLRPSASGSLAHFTRTLVADDQ